MGRRAVEHQQIDESDDHARLVAANRNRNNLGLGGWMKLHVLHLVVWAAVVGAAILVVRACE